MFRGSYRKPIGRLLDTVVEKTPVALTTTSVLIKGAYIEHAMGAAAAGIAPAIFSSVPYFAMLEGMLTSAIAVKDMFMNRAVKKDDLMAFLSGLPLIAAGGYTLFSATALTASASLGLIAIGYAVKSGIDFLRAYNTYVEARINSVVEAKAKQEMGYQFLKFMGFGALILGGFSTGPIAIAGLALGGLTLSTSLAVGFAWRAPVQGLFTKIKLPNINKDNITCELPLPANNSTSRRLMVK